MKRVIIILLVLAATIGISWVGYQYTAPNAHSTSLADDPTVEIVTVERETLLDVVNATGRIEPNAEVELNFEISGVVSEVLVKRGQSVQAGTILARLDTADLKLDIQRAEVELVQRQAELQKLFEPETEQKITASRAKIESARLTLAELVNDPDQENEVTKAAAELVRQEIALKEAQWAYDQVAYRGDIGAMSQANQLQQATLDYEAALADYNIKTRGSTDAELAQARANLAQAENDLAELLQGPSGADIIAKQSAVELAQISLTEKQAALEEAVLTAPTAGVLLEVNIEPGERVLQDAQNPALIVADTSAYLLKVEVDEIDIGRIAQSQTSTIILDAFAEETLEGQVIDISPRPLEKEGNAVVTYEVTLTIDTGQGDPGLLSGMTATANIEIERLEAAIVVPNQAIKIEREAGQSMIYIEKLGEDDEVLRVEVELGLRDGPVTEISAGLEEGDQIIIRRQVEFETGSST